MNGVTVDLASAAVPLPEHAPAQALTEPTDPETTLLAEDRPRFALLAGPVPASELRSGAVLLPFLAWAAAAHRHRSEARRAPGAAPPKNSHTSQTWAQTWPQWADAQRIEEHRCVLEADPDAAELLVARRGLSATLQATNTAAGTSWSGSYFDEIPVRARQVAVAGRSLARSVGSDRAAGGVVSDLHDTPRRRRFGADAAWAEATGCRQVEIGVFSSCALSDDDRTLSTHVVLLEPSHSVAVLTATRVGPEVVREWRRGFQRDGTAGVLGLHEDLCGDALRRGVRLAAALADPGH